MNGKLVTTFLWIFFIIIYPIPLCFSCYVNVAVVGDRIYIFRSKSTASDFGK